MHSQLDIIVPVFNESKNVRLLVDRLSKTLKKAGISYHLYFVDDTSTDTTVKILKKLSYSFPITVLKKLGKRGKAYSILEAAPFTTAPYIAMIDADLQYPPEVLPEMYDLVPEFGVVVAKRNDYDESIPRKVLSRGFQWVFGKFLYGLDCDVQSGLKIFKREIIREVDISDISPWTLDIPLLTTALNLGFTIGEVGITFAKRENGESKIKLAESITEIGSHALFYRFKNRRNFSISPEEKTGMVGAGIIKKGKRFITHTTLESTDSALDVVTRAQKFFVIGLLITIAFSFIFFTHTTAEVLIGILSTIYFIDVFFNLFVIARSLRQPPEISIKPSEVEKLKDKDLPMYSVLCPLYKEAHVIPHFLAAIEKIEWPKNKLDVILLLEADDTDSIDAVANMKLPKYVTVRVVPDSQPKTKPKACNYGLHFAKGKFLVIYDAEDLPDPLQLKKVYCAFQKSAENVKCIQAKLNFYNPHQNLLTRFFTAEYSLWFDVMLTGLQSIETTIPLGGTSNHFRTQDLKDLQGWDPFNVTEDADLGIRLFKRGAITAIIDSITLEEANSNWGNWLRQRSRWIKGYMQTYLVHMRHPYLFFKENGWHALLFQLILGGKIAFMLINPLMWLLTITYFGLYAWLGPTIESLYPSTIFYMAVTSLLFGNFMFIYYYMIGAAKREHWTIIKWTLLVPIYWLMVSMAAAIALYQLIVKPHYWEKTIHGLHLAKIEKKATAAIKETVAEIAAHSKAEPTFERFRIFIPLKSIIKSIEPIREKIKQLSLKKTLELLKKKEYLGGVLFLGATMVANVINMVTNIYLGQALSFEQFGLFSLIISLLYLVSIPINALGSTVNYRASFLLGKYNSQTLYYFWKFIRTRAIVVGSIFSLLWLLLSPYLETVFHVSSPLPFFTFTLLILVGVAAAVDLSYLTARLEFKSIALIVLIQPAIRLASAFIFSKTLPNETYLSITVAVIVSYLVGRALAGKKDDRMQFKHEFLLPRRFFVAALIAGLSSIAFFSLDNLMVAHLLSPEDIGKYSVLGLFGKMIFFVGNLTASFLAPLVARSEGARTNSKKIFKLTFLSVLAMTVAGYCIFALGIYFVGPHYFGSKISAIRDLLPIYGLGISAFTLSQVIVSYYLVKKQYGFPVVGLLLAILEIVLLYLFHTSLAEVVLIMTGIGILYLVVFILLHQYYNVAVSLYQNFKDFIELVVFKRTSDTAQSPESLRILFFNWRDTKHVWAGGAEVYIHEMAKALVGKGHTVTVFCGNDGHHPSKETVDGVEIVRHGGFYTVYFWGFIYYIVRFRKHFDVVIDSENGISFFTPLYVRTAKFLLIHHIHQDVFRQHLPFPFYYIAMLIESKLMPFVYKNVPVITVSESSRKAITKIGLNTSRDTMVINPGIRVDKKFSVKKTTYPSITYFGRLKAYKNIDVALHAFALLLKKIPTAQFNIAGEGEMATSLKKLAKHLEILENVKFWGRVSDEEKVALLSQSWVAVQPSMIEGWGITVIEANSLGTPVVASNVSGLKDSVVDGKTGILVEPKNNLALFEALFLVLTKKRLRTALSKEAIVWAEQFTWDTSAEKLLKNIFDYKNGYQEVSIKPVFSSGHINK